MYFWDINALVHKLKTYTLSSYEQAQYYLALMLCTSFTTITQLLPKQPSTMGAMPIILSWLAGTVVLFGGLAYCYKINKSGDDKDFLTRMICLLFTSAIRFGVLSLLVIMPLSMIIGIIVSLYISPTAIQENATIAFLIGGAFGLLWTISLYWYVGQQFKKIAQ